MTDTTYATKAEFKARINATVAASSGQDSVYQQILNSAANMIDRRTRGGQVGTEAFTESASATRYFDDQVRPDGVIEIDDLLSITSLTRAGSVISAANYQLDPYHMAASKQEPWTRIILLPGATGYFISDLYTLGSRYYGGVGIAQIAIVGTWGYCTVALRPPEIKEATIRQALRMYEYQNLGKQDIGAMLVNPARTNPYNQLDPIVADLLAPYVKDVSAYAF